MTGAAGRPQAAAGFYGKLPARGDFVRAGLPSAFVQAWDGWWQRELSAVQARPDWRAAWLEAPVWRFHLPAGACGGMAALGVWLPSVDRAGRYFPLMVAAVGEDAALLDAARRGFLGAAEQAALDALSHDLEPDDLARRVAAASGPPDDLPGAAWWTDGSPRVVPAQRTAPALPEGAAFATLINDAWANAQADGATCPL